jgi:hypothetical protein
MNQIRYSSQKLKKNWQESKSQMRDCSNSWITINKKWKC